MRRVGRAIAAHREVVWALAVGIAAFAVYLRTLAPGMVAVVDTPMFQFIGRVLGVAHNPGYPLYVLLTHPLSYLPIGSLAYRINLFSAICGALTVSLIFLIARRLECRTSVSAAAALGMAFGHIVWSQAVIAEVYTLDLAIIAGIVFALLVWAETGKPWLFYTAVGLLAAGLGNHTTIVGFVLGMATYAWLKQRPFVTRARTLLATATILVVGMLQYTFILVRSRTPGAYVESPAATLSELAAVVVGRQFGDRLFTFSVREVVFVRLPWLVEHVLVPELTVPVLVLALVGIARLLAWRTAEAFLLVSGCLAITVFALNYDVVDLPVFLIPAIMVLWLTAAVGGEYVIRALPRLNVTGAVAGAAVLALPIWQLTQNFAVTDRSGDTRAATTFDRLFDELPDRSGLISEDFLVDRMVMYKLLGEPPAHGRRIDRIERSADAARQGVVQGGKLFAFAKSAEQLRYHALDVAFAPLKLLDEELPVFLSQVPTDRVVAIAVPAVLMARFVASGAAALDGIGAEQTIPAGSASAFTAIGVTGARGARAELQRTHSRITVGARDAIGATGFHAAAATEVEATQTAAAIRQGGRDLVRSTDGAVLAIWRPDGRLEQTSVLQLTDDFRVPIPAGPLSVYPLRGLSSVQPVNERWESVTSVTETGSVILTVPAESTMAVYVADEAPLAPRVVHQSSPDTRVSVAVSDNSPAPVMADTATIAAPHVYRIDVNTSDQPVSVLMALGGVPGNAVARLERGKGVATLLRVDTTGLLRTPDRSSEVLLLSRDERQLTGPGWSDVDWDAVSPFRWMTDVRARLLLPTSAPHVQSIRIQALRESGPAPSEIRLLLNNHDLGARVVGDGWQSYEWVVPGGTVRPGTNIATLVVDALSATSLAAQPRALAVSDVTMRQASSP